MIILAVILAATMVLSLLLPVLADDSTASSGTEAASEDVLAPNLTDSGAAADTAAGTASEDTAVSGASSADASESGTIMEGITAGGISLGGLTVAEAKEKVAAAVAEKASQSLTVSANGKTAAAKLSDLGYAWTNTDVLDSAPELGKCGNVIARYKFKKDIEQAPYALSLELGLSDDAIRTFLQSFEATANVKAVEPTLQSDEAGTLTVSEGSDGAVIDEDASVSAVRTYLLSQWSGGDASLELPTVAQAPALKADDLSKIKDVLGSGQTVYAGSSDNRTQNIVNGVSKVNGTVVAPGGQFSLIGTVAPFSAENGYATAPSYSSGEIVDTYGGGICQVSTTLYMAVLQAELEVDKRTNHSMLVGYVTPSMDAAISEEGGKDMVFTNNTDYPIYIMGSSDNGTISFRIYGVETRDPKRTVTYESKVIKETQPPDQVALDDTVDYGTVEQVSYGHVGTESELWKHVTDADGKTTDSLVNSDTYEMSPIKYILGTKGADASELDAFQKDGTAAVINIEDYTQSITNSGVAVNIVQMPEGSAKSDAEDSD